MMSCMGYPGGPGWMMMTGMTIQWIVLLVLAGLGIAALVKYLRTPPR